MNFNSDYDQKPGILLPKSETKCCLQLYCKLLWYCGLKWAWRHKYEALTEW